MNKFLGSQPNLGAVTDGSMNLFGATIGAANFTPNFPVRADASRRLYSTTLSISDITGLQADLADLQTRTQNIDPLAAAPGVTPFLGAISATSEVEAVGFTMQQWGIPIPAQANRGILWSDTSDQLHYVTTGGGDQIVNVGTGTYLPLAGGTMAGPINMGTQQITNTHSIRTSGSSIIIGNGSTDAKAANSVSIGPGSVTNAVSSVAIGNGAVTVASDSIAIGVAYATETNSVALGNNAVTDKANSVAIGSIVYSSQPNTITVGYLCSSTAQAGHTIGNSITNSTANSLLIDATANFRSNAACDLGTSAKPFGGMYLSKPVVTVGNNNVCIGSGSTVAPPTANVKNILIGAGNTSSGAPGLIQIGDTTNYLLGSGNSVLIGTNVTANGDEIVAIGDSANVAGSRSAAYGPNNTISATESFIFGAGLTNNDTHTMLLGSGSILNIRPGNNSMCDLGTTTAKFKDLHLSGNVAAATPVCFSGYAQGPWVVSYTAATPKLVSTATLTESSDPSGMFTPMVGSGGVQYTGAITRTFLVTILYNILGAASAQTYSGWVSKGGSTTPVEPRAMNFTAATPVGYLPYEVSNIYSLATGNIVQLASQYSATANVNIFDIKVIIIQLS